jgi:hypothetical protein
LERKLATWGKSERGVSAAPFFLLAGLFGTGPARKLTSGLEVTGVSNMPMKGSPLIALTTSFCVGHE